MTTTGKKSGIDSIVILVALCSYIISSTAILPASVSLLTFISGDHGISVLKQNEVFSIVLNHRAEKGINKQPTEPHHHNILSDAIVFFSNNTRETETDHILSFSVSPESASWQQIHDYSELIRPFSVHGEEFRAIDWTDAPKLQNADYFEPLKDRLLTEVRNGNGCVEAARCVVLLI